jgi:DNA repair exonuclease SbcCD ATPase subunit
LESGESQRVREEGGRHFSRELNLWFGWGPQETFVRLWTPEGRMLLTVEETKQRLEQAEQRAQEERRLREEAEARAAALAAELDRLRQGGV